MPHDHRSPKPAVFGLRGQLLARGRSDTLCAETDDLTITLKVYAEGGENALHAHPEEAHAFVVLSGEATFSFAEEPDTTVGPHQGVLLPKGTYYSFRSTGQGNLVMLRVGTPGQGAAAMRIDLEGASIAGDSAANKHVDPVPLEGEFFGPPASPEEVRR